jgi:hypothetical protein
MEYLVSLADVGMQAFLFFSGRVVGGGDGIFGVSCGCGEVFLFFQHDKEKEVRTLADPRPG